MKIVACVNVYNEELFLPLCLSSLRKKVDEIVLVDGAYQDFPSEYCFSTDDTLKIAQRFRCKIITNTKFWEDEIEKRNTYLDYVFTNFNDHDYILVVDADEVITGDFPRELNKEAYYIKQVRFQLPPSQEIRLFRNQKGLHYQGCHNALFIGDRLLNKEKWQTLEEPYCYHLSDLRDNNRIEAKGEYIRKLKEKEKKFRKENQL